MVGSQFLIYYSPATGGFTLPDRPAWERQPIGRMIADALRLRTNTIAGRPNVGNLALEFTHKGRSLPAAVLRDYVLRTLRSLIPNVRFQVQVSDGVDGGGFQHVAVSYEVL
jgi:hypothetical protein